MPCVHKPLMLHIPWIANFITGFKYLPINNNITLGSQVCAAYGPADDEVCQERQIGCRHYYKHYYIIYNSWLQRLHTNWLAANY